MTITVPGYDYVIDFNDGEFRCGVLMDRYSAGVIEISDNAIFELAKKLFPERIKDAWL